MAERGRPSPDGATAWRYDAMLSRMRFTKLAGCPLRGAAGDQLGRLTDCVVRLLDGALPQLTGVLARLGGREVFVAMADVGQLGPQEVRLRSDRVDTRPFERRPGEVLLGRDVLRRAVIDMVEARLIRVADLVLEGQDLAWYVRAVIPSPAWNPARTLGRVLRHEAPLEEVDWRRIEPLVGHVPTAARRHPSLRLAMLRPADIADIVEEASHEEGKEILEAVHQDHELEADVFEELDEEHQVEFVSERTDAEIAALLADMGPDDAADLLMKLDRKRRRPVLQLLPRSEQDQVRRLLGYNPETAGGLMSTEFVALPEGDSVQAALARLRQLPELPETLAAVYTVQAERLTGALTLARLLRAEPAQTLREVADRHPIAVFPDADVPSVAVEMADYNLAALPVVDRAGHLLGVITYDDLVDAMLPEEWRWRGEANQEHRYEPIPAEGSPEAN